MKFSNDIKELFSIGAKVVYDTTLFYSNKEVNVNVLRMPKGSFISDNRKKYDGNSFEYIIVKNYLNSDTFNISSYTNNTLRGVKKSVHEDKYD